VVNMKNLRVILRYSVNSFQQTLSNLPVFFIFLFSKIVRYALFGIFIFTLFSQVSPAAGFTGIQMLMFYLIFNLIDTTSQLLYREVYRFRPLVVSGGFDLVLTKPFPPLLRVLLGGPDLMDLGMLLIIISLLVYISGTFIHPSLDQTLIFFLLFINSLALATAFHIFVLGIGIITLSVDHLVMIYRDLTSLVRIPVDFFTDSLRFLLTFIIPVGIMFTFPAKALMGLLSWPLVVLSLLISTAVLSLSFFFWRYSLRFYQSASS